MLKRLVSGTGLVLLMVMVPAVASAVTYNTGKYGECAYSEGCTPPEEIPPSTSDPVISTPPPSPPTVPTFVERDIDNDGNPEKAIDTNLDSVDGYEQYDDADSSSTMLRSLDGDDDQKIDFLINTDADDRPERYWDPDNNILSTIQLLNCGPDSTPVWRFDTGEETRTYDPSEDEFIDNCDIAPARPLPASGTDRDDNNSSQGKTRFTNAIPFLADSPVYQAIGEVIKDIPAPVAYSFPYLLLLILLMIALRLIWQSKQEVHRLRIAAEAVETENRLALEKENFMRLSSHYLRTPITVVRGNIELMQSLKQISEELAKTLSTAGNLLMDHVSSLLEHLDDKKLANIKPVAQNAALKTALSPFFILPIAGIIFLMVVSHLLFIDFRVKSPNILDLLVQVALAVLIVQLLVSKFRARHLNRVNRQDQERVLAEQRTLDAARNKFITDVANNLDQQLKQFNAQLGDLANRPEAVKVKKSLKELDDMVSKFRLVAYLHSHQLDITKSNLNLQEATIGAVAPYQQKAQARGITFNVSADSAPIYQQKQLMSIVLQSVIDNAVKFSPDNSTIEVEAKADGEQAVFTVHDHGQGIARDKQDLLFKPFSRTESTETFNTEGLGFSLYLDKVITHYLKGDINVSSEQSNGTIVNINLPTTDKNSGLTG